MTKAKLKQLRHLSKEIELLKQQIEGLETVVVTDKVKGSLSEHPYIETTYTIKGLVHERSAKVERLKSSSSAEWTSLWICGRKSMNSWDH